MTKPIWFLDVDGVLNALPINRWGDLIDPDYSVWPDWKIGMAGVDGFRFTITWSPTVIDFIKRTIDEGLADVRWLTTWRATANNELRELLGLPELPVAGPRTLQEQVEFHQSVENNSGWWKLNVVAQTLSEDPTHPAVWTDDQLHMDFLQPNKPDLSVYPNLHTVVVNDSTGLTRQDLDKIQQFLELHAATSSR